MKNYISNKGEELLYEDRLKLLKMIQDWGYKIHEHRDGSRIDLDKIKIEHLKKIKIFIEKKLKVPTIYKIHG
jgi:hypothetical protein